MRYEGSRIHDKVAARESLTTQAEMVSPTCQEKDHALWKQC